MLRAYTACDPAPSPGIKMIANTYFAAGFSYHPHNLFFRCAAAFLLKLDERRNAHFCYWHTFDFADVLGLVASLQLPAAAGTARCESRACSRGDAVPVNEQRWPLNMHFGDYSSAGAHCSPPFNGIHCHVTPAAQMYRVTSGAEPSVARVALFHYVTRSRDDFAAKHARGSGMSRTGKSWVFFEAITKCGFGCDAL